MTAKVILNPYSNRWNSQKLWPEAESALKAAGVDFDLAVSQKKGQIVELAERAVHEKFSPIIVAGGDGSIGDAANGLMRAVQSNKRGMVPLGILPTGSANDLIYALGLPSDLKVAAKIIAAGKTRAMDLGKLNGRYFVNNSAGGLEPYVTTKQERIKWVKGIPRYVLAAVQGIMDKPEWHGHIKWDDGKYSGPISLITVGNGQRSGGFFMTPHANLFDGKLTLVYAYRPTRLSMFQALPRALNPDKGSYVELEGIHEIHTTHVSIHLDEGSPAHTDGELLPDRIQDFEYEILPQCLNIIVP
jgi:diacylglycerol kinase (ATP)